MAACVVASPSLGPLLLTTLHYTVTCLAAVAAARPTPMRGTLPESARRGMFQASRSWAALGLLLMLQETERPGGTRFNKPFWWHSCPQNVNFFNLVSNLLVTQPWLPFIKAPKVFSSCIVKMYQL